LSKVPAAVIIFSVLKALFIVAPSLPGLLQFQSQPNL
jgi:hypothetical protein